MKPHYLLEAGIRPWEESVPPANSSFATISTVVESLVDLSPIINKIFSTLEPRVMRWFRWHTSHRLVDESAVQKRKLLAAVGSDIGKFRNPIMRLDPQSVSSVGNVVLPITELELEILGDYRRELLIGVADSNTNPESLLQLIGTDWEVWEPQTLVRLLSSAEGLVCGRCYDDPDTHSTFQWFGRGADLGLIEKALIGLGVRKLLSRDEVFDLMHE